MSSITHVILARGGSKGVHRKNLRFIGGESLLVRAIKALQNAGQRNIVVSSDDREILDVGATHDCIMHLRSHVHANDSASSEDALLECVKDLKIESSHISLVQCTNAFWSPIEIKACVETIQRPECDSTFAASIFNHFVWQILDSEVIVSPDKNLPRRRRQDIKETKVLELGSIYIMDRLLFTHERNRFCGNCIPSVIDKKIHFEIDKEDDLKLANQLNDFVSQML